MRHLNYGHLQYFWAVTHEGGVRKAAQYLHVTPQTVSMQLRALEQSIGSKLFEKDGRRLALTKTGKLVQRYADDIFALGEELAAAVRGRTPHAPQLFRVGIVDVVPKLLAQRVLAPVLKLDPSVRLICQEGSMEQLVGQLALHQLDLVLADAPLPPGLHVRAYSHAIGESGTSFLAPRKLARKLKKQFPASLDGAPLLLPTSHNVMRRQLDQWFEAEGISPAIVAEFDDSALMKAFSEAGQFVVPVPSVIEASACSHYSLETVGRSNAVREQLYAITVERRIKHPAILSVTNTSGDVWRNDV